MSTSHHSPLSLIVRLTGPATSEVVVAGELDAAGVASLTSLATALVQVGVRHAVLDVSGVTFVDLAGWRALADTRRHIEASGITIEVAGRSAAAARLDALTGVVSSPDTAGTGAA
ncbi:MAG: STAS domain-containing protein [Acidimicrobiales bacterium]